ncbi:MAG: site-specific DNA-methyltransferase [Calditrichaeota bacterium]|nr:site-specific DNA-methyltransferase [Calditrichota bacterium]
MPTLEWIGKKAVLNHHKEVPFRLLKTNEELSAGAPDCGNLLVQGDNLEALKALLPYYAGKVKCIYIDPPYNTGKSDWIYNDNVNSPETKDWLHKVVKSEDEDLSRHDKWLCMMYPRIRLLKEFLSEEGIIFVSIDDNEVSNLNQIMSDIFGEKNFLANLIWDLGTGTAAGHFTRSHEYILTYAKNKSILRNFSYIGDEDKISERAVKKISKGNPASQITFPVGMEFEGKDATFNGVYGNSEKIRIMDSEMKFVDGKLINEVTIEAGWAMRNQILSWISGQDTIDSKGQIVTKFFFDKKGVLQYEKIRGFINPQSVIRGIASTRKGSALLEEIMGERKMEFPKPVELISYLISLITTPESIILDSFAGSGTTAHAVLSLNNKYGSNRKFIVIECEDYVNTLTAERIRRVIKGVINSKDPQLKVGLGGGFRYVELGPTLFDAEGRIRPEITYAELAHHIHFTETGEPLSETGLSTAPLLGISKGSAIYLLYNGILKDKRANGGNVLTKAILERLPVFDGPKIIYGTACRLGQKFLNERGITFRQIPYEIKVS